MGLNIDNNLENRKFYTCSEVAKKLGLSEQVISQMCEGGKFSGAKRSNANGGYWLIPKENFVTSTEQDNVADKILQTIDKKTGKLEILMNSIYKIIYMHPI